MILATGAVLAVSTAHTATTGGLGTVLLLGGLLWLLSGKHGKMSGTTVVVGLLLLWAAMHGSSDTSTPVTPSRPPAIVTPHHSAPHHPSSGSGHQQPAPKQSCLLICGITTKS